MKQKYKFKYIFQQIWRLLRGQILTVVVNLYKICKINNDDKIWKTQTTNKLNQTTQILPIDFEPNGQIHVQASSF